MIVKPDYYDKFTCIGGSCSFTCCMQWKIAVDDDTYKKWKTQPAPAGGVLTARQNGFKKTAKLADYTRMKEGGRVVRLLKNGNCPFLDDCKLCRIVSEQGDSMISKTCQIFPREEHRFMRQEEVREFSLMPCCPVIVDFLDQADIFHLENESDKVSSGASTLFELRSYLMQFVQREELSPETALKAIFFMALENLKRSKQEACEEEESLYLIPDEAEEYEILKTILEMVSSVDDCRVECNELFLDLCYNYQKEGLYQDLLIEVCNLAEEISEQGLDRISADRYEAFEECWQTYHPLMKKFLAEEIFADSLEAESTMEDMVVRLEWIAMEYVAIRQICFLNFALDKELPYEKVRDNVVLISRMMGYDEDDIVEYLENSFESLVWDWGYLALITG